MLNEWSDRMPEPPPEGSWAEYIYLAVVGVLGALFVASIFAGLILVKVAVALSCAPTDRRCAPRPSTRERGGTAAGRSRPASSARKRSVRFEGLNLHSCLPLR